MLIRNYLNIPFKDNNFDHINKELNKIFSKKFENDRSKIKKIFINNDSLQQINDYPIDKNQLIEVYNNIFYISKINFDYFTSISKIFMKICKIDGDIIEFGVYKRTELDNSWKLNKIFCIKQEILWF